MKKLIVGNWKMNGDGQLLESFLMSNVLSTQEASEIVLCPPVVLLPEFSKSSHAIKLGAQDCSSASKGAFTGDISASMLVALGIRYTLVGHSERRRYQRETNDQCAAKAFAAQKSGLTPIFCIGEGRKDYEHGLTYDVLVNQMESLIVHDIDFDNLVIAYEPVWSIGTGLLPQIDEIVSVMSSIRQWIINAKGIRTANQVRLLYGGSVNDKNAGNILELEPVSGVLVGGASLDPDTFSAIAAAA